MRRRQFIALFGGVAATWPLAARAQQPEGMRRIGVLTPFTEGDQEAKAWLMAFQEGSLPIVFVQVSDPVKLGVVANLARPGANITGFTNFEHAIGGKWLELIRDTAPGTQRVLVIFEPDLPAQLAYLQAIEAAAPTFRMELVRAGVHNAAEIEGHSRRSRRGR